MRLKINFYWHTETDDVDLGIGLLDVLPPVGALIAHQAPGSSHTVWRVVTAYVHPSQPGSMNDVRGDRTTQFGIYMLFVEPAEGPFHAGEVEEGPTDGQ